MIPQFELDTHFAIPAAHPRTGMPLAGTTTFKAVASTPRPISSGSHFVTGVPLAGTKGVPVTIKPVARLGLVGVHPTTGVPLAGTTGTAKVVSTKTALGTVVPKATLPKLTIAKPVAKKAVATTLPKITPATSGLGNISGTWLILIAVAAGLGLWAYSMR